MHPIIPMEPRRADVVPDGPNWIAQVKWDGVRMLTYHCAGDTQLYNRRLRLRTQHFPEFCDVASYCTAKSIILDGEMVALGADGLPSFPAVMRRDGLRQLRRVAAMQRMVPVFYMLFDVLYLNGEWLTAEPLRNRLSILGDAIRPTQYVQPVDSVEDGRGLLALVQSRSMEGIVAKNLDSTYLPGKQTDDWRKIKNYRDVVAVVGGFTVNDSGGVNSLLFGLYDGNGQLHYVGHAGSGKLRQPEWRDLTRQLTQSVSLQCPFSPRPTQRNRTLWVIPLVTAKVQFMAWTEHGSMRQPTVQSLAPDPPQTCVLDAEFSLRLGNGRAD